MTLHILNGDALGAAFERFGLRGEVLVFREAMACGPCPASAPRDQFLDTRARHLAEAYGANGLRARRELSRREARLDALGPTDEVFLWFDDDLFCQVHLWYLLDRIGDRCRVRIVAGEERTGTPAPGDLPRLALEAQPATAAMVDWGRRAYRAFGGEDPTALQRLCLDTAPLAFAPIAARLHLERFPSTTDGLGRLERCVLGYVAAGIDRFGDLFRQLCGDQGGYGFGDAQVFALAAALALGATPLLRLHGTSDGAAAVSAKELRGTSFSITAQGRAALAGERDAVAGVCAERWLGGTRLPPGRAPFRWDPAAGCIVRVPDA